MKHAIVLVVAFFIALSVAGCARESTGTDPASHREAIEQWQKRRVSRLLRPDGWLTLIGLTWLRPGQNSIGADSSNDVVIESPYAPPKVGTISLRDSTLSFTAHPGVMVTRNDTVVQTTQLLTDAAATPTVLHVNSVLFYVIKRGDRLGVRLKDSLSTSRTGFKGLEFFPISTKWRFSARFQAYQPPKVLKIATQANSVEEYSAPGALVFEYDGTEYRLDAVIEPGAEDQLFVMFSDETSGKETYSPGRQLYTSLPDSAGRVILDFNKAYNWPCVFTEFATCPVPPKQNHLQLRVEAGEKMYRGHK